jgi:hypothetical protein
VAWAPSHAELPAAVVSGADAPPPTQRAQGRCATFVSLTTGHRLGLSIVLMFALTIALFVANVLELPLLAFALLGTLVVGAFGASLRLGRWRLHRNTRLLDNPTRRTEAFFAIESLASGPWRVQPVGVDARGWIALHRLEQGDLGGALVQARAIRLCCLHRERRRTPGTGFFGEAVSSLLGHLFPEAGLEVTPSGSFRVDEDSLCEQAPRQLETLSAALRLLEAVDRAAVGPVLRAWSELDVDALRRTAPVLATLTSGAAARVVPTLEPGLVAAVHGLDARRRRLVLRRFPHLRQRSGATYRMPARSPKRDEPFLQAAPQSLADLPSRVPCQWLPRAPRWARAIGWLILAQAAGSIIWLGQPLFIVAALACVPMLAGSFLHRSARVTPLRDAGITAPARLRELRRMRSRACPRRSGDCEHPFERGELMLIVGLHRAERAFRKGDPDEARCQILWWLGGADQATVHRIHAVAIGASSIRVAALLGMDDVAARMADAFEPDTRSIAIGPRSGHGDAPVALAFARAVAHALAGRWGAAARTLWEAEDHPPVTLDAFERELYGVLVHRIRVHGHSVPPRLTRLASSAPARWVDRAWPP